MESSWNAEDDIMIVLTYIGRSEGQRVGLSEV
jgi:hypothetical protein